MLEFFLPWGACSEERRRLCAWAEVSGATLQGEKKKKGESEHSRPWVKHRGGTVLWHNYNTLCHIFMRNRVIFHTVLRVLGIKKRSVRRRLLTFSFESLLSKRVLHQGQCQFNLFWFFQPNFKLILVVINSLIICGHRQDFFKLCVILVEIFVSQNRILVNVINLCHSEFFCRSFFPQIWRFY